MKTYDVGAVMNILYGFETNIRIQNIPNSGFYGGMIADQIFWRGLQPKDFALPEGQVFNVADSPTWEYNKWYFSKSLKELCSFLFISRSNEDPCMFEQVEKQSLTGVEKILNEVHNEGYQFIIESNWDLGYDIYLLNKNRNIFDIEQLNSYDANEIAEWVVCQTTESKNKRKIREHKILQNSLKVSV